jgi:hypothetical protein
MNAISKCVLDDVHNKALLAMALQEGLVEIDDSRTDGVYRELRHIHISNELKNSLLEQITLTPNIISDDTVLLNGVQGELFENGVLSFVPRYNSSIDTTATIPFPTLMAMLHFRQNSLSEGQVIEIIEKVQNALKEEDDYVKKTGKKPPSSWLRQILSLSINDKYEGAYSDEEYTAQERRESIYNEGKPIIECYNDYVKTVSLSNRENALIKVPAIEFVYGTPNIEQYKNNEYVLFRVVAEGLGQLTYMPSLKETLMLSKESATNELRFQLQEWIDNICSSNINEIGYVKNEIKNTLSKLNSRRKYGTIGKFVTYIGLPLTCIGLLNPLASIPGLLVSIAGVLTTAQVSYIERKYKWAMFGSK